MRRLISADGWRVPGAATHHVPGAEIVHLIVAATVQSRSAMMIRRSRSTILYDHRHLTGWRRWGWTMLVRTELAAHLVVRHRASAGDAGPRVLPAPPGAADGLVDGGLRPAEPRRPPLVSAQRRIFVLAPYPPGSLPAHGGSVAIAALVTALCRRNRVALVYLRADDEAPADAALQAQCEVSIECRRQGTSVSSVRPLHRVPRLLPQVLQGQPLWVASRWSAELAAVVRRVVDSWSPDIVQAESGAMGAYFAAAAGGARTVVTFHDAEAVTSTERSRVCSVSSGCFTRPKRRCGGRMSGACFGRPTRALR